MTIQRPYRLCNRCIMDTSDPDITFDEDGTCCYCKVFDQRIKNEVFHGPEGQRRLEQMADKMKQGGKGRKYDCLVGVSGGTDSTMAVWTLKKLNLRILAIHLDNGWNSEIAVNNIKVVLDKLKIDLYTQVLEWEEFRDLQLSFLRASVPNCEIPTDHAIVALHFKVAREHGIKFIVNGANVSTEAFIPQAWGYDARDFRHLKAIHNRFGKAPLKSFPSMSIGKTLYDVFIRGIRWIAILNYIDYHKPEAIKLLENEFGWRPYGGKHYESVYTRFYQGYILLEKFGFNKKRAHLANLVLAGHISRDEALAEMKKEDYVGTELWVQDKEFVLKKLQLSSDEFEAIMKQAPKTHYDYPTNRLLFEKMPKLFRVFKRFATRA